MAGSAKAAEPVRFIVIREHAQKDALAKCGDFTPHVVAAPVVVVLVLEPELGRVGAPFSIFRGPFDAGRAAQNMMVAAWAEGVSSCPASMHRPDDAAKVLGLPEGHVVANTIAFGYPAANEGTRQSRPRQPLEEYVHYERW